MIIFFGTRAYFTALALVQFACPRCQVNAAQRVLRQITKFTLFFIPTFTTSTRYLTECTNCGSTIAISEQQAHEYVNVRREVPTAPFEEVRD